MRGIRVNALQEILGDRDHSHISLTCWNCGAPIWR